VLPPRWDAGFGADRKIYNARICLDAGRSSFGEKLVGAMALKGMLNCSIKVFELLQIVKLESSSNWIHLIAKSRL
jgi:hypothetical protein